MLIRGVDQLLYAIQYFMLRIYMLKRWINKCRKFQQKIPAEEQNTVN